MINLLRIKLENHNKNKCSSRGRNPTQGVAEVWRPASYRLPPIIFIYQKEHAYFHFSLTSLQRLK